MSSPQDRLCVVVVDDDGSMRKALARILDLAGYSAFTFPSAEALLETSHALKADCLVLDVFLPGFTGIELYERLSSAGVAPPVIFISAYEEPDISHVRAPQPVGFLAKPFSGRTLIAEIARVLDAQDAARLGGDI